MCHQPSLALPDHSLCACGTILLQHCDPTCATAAILLARSPAYMRPITVRPCSCSLLITPSTLRCANALAIHARTTHSFASPVRCRSDDIYLPLAQLVFLAEPTLSSCQNVLCHCCHGILLMGYWRKTNRHYASADHPVSQISRPCRSSPYTSFSGFGIMSMATRTQIGALRHNLTPPRAT